jgi:hypothetical protein
VEQLPDPAEGEWIDFGECARAPRDCIACTECKHLRFGNAKRQHRVNWAVNKALKLGLTVRHADSFQDLESWFPLYLLAMQHNAVPPRSLRFFRQLWSNLWPDGYLQLLLAEQTINAKKRLVAGSLLLMFGQTVAYAFTGCAPQDLALHGHDLLQISAIRDSCKGGFRCYDFGEVSEDHESLAQFKSKWGTEPKRLYRYYYPALSEADVSGEHSRWLQLARRIWRTIPPIVTASLGDFIYDYL